MTREEAIQALRDEQDCGDTEVAHINADDVLCDLLKSLGYADVVLEYEKIEKWHA